MPTSVRRWPATLLVGLVLTWAVGQVGGGAAQTIRKSQQGTVAQMIGETRVSIVYNRPVARGRELFGALVPYAKEWCPGADSATTITLSGDVLVAGQPLAAGEHPLGHPRARRLDDHLQPRALRVAHAVPPGAGGGADPGEAREGQSHGDAGVLLSGGRGAGGGAPAALGDDGRADSAGGPWKHPLSV